MRGRYAFFTWYVERRVMFGKMCFIARKPRIGFTVKLADIPIEVHALYRQTKTFCRDYLSGEPPALSVSISRADIRKERELSINQAKKEGRKQTRFSSHYLETLALCRKVTAELLAHDVILVHGAVMAVDGRAYLFTAKSGTGKTTHCRLWQKNVPNCHILNGDKPLLLFKNGKIYACGSPWRGKENYGINEMLPLEAVCILERDKTNHIEEIALKDCFETLVNQTHIPDGNGSFAKAVGMVKQFSAVKLYRLGCNMDDEAARAAYHTVVKKKEMR